MIDGVAPGQYSLVANSEQFIPAGPTRIEVADNGDGEGAALSASPSTGVGLANIRDRLSQAYGAAHRFDTRKNDRGGFSVILEIPFETGDTNT